MLERVVEEYNTNPYYKKKVDLLIEKDELHSINSLPPLPIAEDRPEGFQTLKELRNIENMEKTKEVKNLKN